MRYAIFYRLRPKNKKMGSKNPRAENPHYPQTRNYSADLCDGVTSRT
jgi:hypothetical protein